MKHTLLAVACLLSACTAQQSAAVATAAATPSGQLFCAVQTSGGGAVVVALANAELSAAAPAVAPVAVMATGMAKSYVDAACAQAGGIAVSPPANPSAVPVVAVKPPA